MTLEQRIKAVLEILERWKRNNVNNGWVSGLVLATYDAGGMEFDKVLAAIRERGTTIETATFGRWGTMHYRLADRKVPA